MAHEDEPGQRLFISGTVKQNDCELTTSGAIIEIWQANDDGCYGIIEDCNTGNPENDYFNLRGKFFSDINGDYNSNLDNQEFYDSSMNSNFELTKKTISYRLFKKIMNDTLVVQNPFMQFFM